jgi:hypothetical protein
MMPCTTSSTQLEQYTRTRVRSRSDGYLATWEYAYNQLDDEDTLEDCDSTLHLHSTLSALSPLSLLSHSPVSSGRLSRARLHTAGSGSDVTDSLSLAGLHADANANSMNANVNGSVRVPSLSTLSSLFSPHTDCHPTSPTAGVGAAPADVSPLLTTHSMGLREREREGVGEREGESEGESVGEREGESERKKGIVFSFEDGDVEVSSARVHSLLDWLLKRNTDVDFLKTILLTYCHFCSASYVCASCGVWVCSFV